MIRGKRRESIFIPDVEELNVEESDLDESPDNSQINTVNESLKMLNEFLACRDVSPVRTNCPFRGTVLTNAQSEDTAVKQNKVSPKSLKLLLQVKAISYCLHWVVTYPLSEPRQRWNSCRL